MIPIDKASAGVAERIEGLTPKPQPQPSAPTKGGSEAVPFSELLGNLQQRPSAAKSGSAPDLKFSTHAQTRMQSRGIELSPDELVKLREAVNLAGSKGSRESLILTDKAAFVVSVKNGTVITAVDRESLKENIFTNIDSTVMI